jgi:hypothetical protein
MIRGERGQMLPTPLKREDQDGNLHNCLDRVEHNRADNQLRAWMEGLRFCLNY